MSNFGWFGAIIAIPYFRKAPIEINFRSVSAALRYLHWRQRRGIGAADSIVEGRSEGKLPSYLSTFIDGYSMKRL